MRWVDGPTLTAHPDPDAWRDTGVQIRIAHDLGGEPPFGTGFGGFEPEQPTWRLFFDAFAESMLRDCEHELEFRSTTTRAATRSSPATGRAARSGHNNSRPPMSLGGRNGQSPDPWFAVSTRR